MVGGVGCSMYYEPPAKKDLGVDRRLNLFSLTLCTRHFSRDFFPNKTCFKQVSILRYEIGTQQIKIKEMYIQLHNRFKYCTNNSFNLRSFHSY